MLRPPGKPGIQAYVFASAILLLSTVAQAHPHAWIYIDTSFVVDDGHITAIKQDWRYDRLLTEALLDGLGKESASGTADVSYYANETINNLKPHSYFLNLTQNGQTVPIGDVTQFSADLQDDRLHLRFVAPLPQPVSLQAGD